MIPVIPDSSSVMLRATHILLLRIESAQIGEWLSSPGPWLHRSAHLTLTLEETAKGVTNEIPGQQVRVTIEQFSAGLLPVGQVPGVWSGQILDPGTELIAFCRSTETETAKLLEQGSCEQLMPISNLPDVRLALQAEAMNASAEELLALATALAGSLGYVFAEYAWAKLAGPAMADPKVFDLLLQFVELNDLSLIVRWHLVKSIYALITPAETIPDWYVHRFAVSMFRLMNLPEDPGLADNISQVFLPNLLGIQGALTKRAADDVFRDFPDDRPPVQQTMSDAMSDAKSDKLLEWLQQGNGS